MQKAQLAAALAATLGFALHGTAFAADNSLGVTEKTTKTEKNVKIAKHEASSEKGAEAACKGKDGSCKGKESSCKGKDGSCKGKDASCKGKKHTKKTTKETKTETKTETK
jgi:hypothetical protein